MQTQCPWVELSTVSAWHLNPLWSKYILCLERPSGDVLQALHGRAQGLLLPGACVSITILNEGISMRSTVYSTIPPEFLLFRSRSTSTKSNHRVSYKHLNKVTGVDLVCPRIELEILLHLEVRKLIHGCGLLFTDFCNGLLTVPLFEGNCPRVVRFP